MEDRFLFEQSYQPTNTFAPQLADHPLFVIFCFFAPFLYQLSILRQNNISHTIDFEMGGIAVMKMIHCLDVVTSLLISKTSILIMSLCMNHAAV